MSRLRRDLLWIVLATLAVTLVCSGLVVGLIAWWLNLNFG